MLNLITDPWIPVRRADGVRDVIRPDQIAETDIVALNWPRPDLNLACLELLIGLVYVADPPETPEDWQSRQPDPTRLRRALEVYKDAFNLMGDGPRFMQDLEELPGKVNSTDMLFIDSAGDQTQKKNADLMVKRSRYAGLEPALAAMALYTMQSFAPAGGAGNRTSMRGGGPMVTLVQPRQPGLWPLIWANVPYGEALPVEMIDSELPWMRPAQVSDKGQVAVMPEDVDVPIEAFFGMPRRLRLTAVNSGEGDTAAPMITGVVQKPYGANYQGWIHPLSPYYHIKNEVLPKHPKPGSFNYRNWQGIVLQNDQGDRAACVERYLKQRRGEVFDMLVGGWAMSNMSPLDFLWSEAPVYPLDDAAEAQAGRLVQAAEHVGFTLAANVKQGCGESDLSTGASERARTQFFAQTQAPFEAALDRLSQGGADGAAVAQDWLKTCAQASLRLFDAEVMPGLAGLSETRRQNAVDARKSLIWALRGYGGLGKKIFGALDMDLPAKGKRKEVRA